MTVVLDKPTRDGDTELHLLTNVPVKHARAGVVADLYRRRWTIETAFAEMEKVLNGEINVLGYPKAALFSFCMALVAYNVLSTVKGALRSVHGETKVEKLSGFYLADEIQMCHRGMMKAIPKDEWVVFKLRPQLSCRGDEGVGTLGTVGGIREQPARAKETKAEEAERREDKHVSTFRILKARKVCTT